MAGLWTSKQRANVITSALPNFINEDVLEIDFAKNCFSGVSIWLISSNAKKAASKSTFSASKEYLILWISNLSLSLYLSLSLSLSLSARFLGNWKIKKLVELATEVFIDEVFNKESKINCKELCARKLKKKYINVCMYVFYWELLSINTFYNE